VKKTLFAAALLAIGSIPVIVSVPAQAAPCGGGGSSPACTSCIQAALAGGHMNQPAYQACYLDSGQAPMQFPQCDVYPALMDRQICTDNVARGLPADNIRRP
jgi:hypothetical protein